LAGIEEEGIPCNANFIVWEGGSSFSRANVMIECEQRSSIIASHILPTNAPVTHVHFRREQKGEKPQPSPDVHETKLSSQESPIIGIDSQRRSIAYSDVYTEDVETGAHVGNLLCTGLGSIPNLDRFFFSSAHSFKYPALLPEGSKTSGVQSQWKRMQLAENKENTALVDGQVISANVRFGPGIRDSMSLALRRSVVESGTVSALYDVLSWLCHSGDYFTGATIALRLLHDDEAVRDLSRREDKMHDGDGLLDGILVPLDVTITHTDAERVQLQASLADVAAGCMIRGGEYQADTVSFFSALEGFLRRNKYYDASRACVMLAAATSDACLALRDSKVAAAPAENRRVTDNILNSVRCFLCVAVARDCMPTALSLLNEIIPDELRGRERKESNNENILVLGPPLALSKEIVTMILASSPLAGGCLLNLKDEDASTRYWQSLDHETQLAFSCISVGSNTFSLLREVEVRTWVLQKISDHLDLLHARNDGKRTRDGEELPREWIMALCEASLINAGCRHEESSFLLKSRGPASLVDGAAGSDTIRGYDSIYSGENNGYKVDFLSLFSDPGRIDFNLLISALLCEASTRPVLIAVCDLAGRQVCKEPEFAFDAAAAIKLCAQAGNSAAAAALLGGREGFVLRCADILIEFFNISMKQAEIILMTFPENCFSNHIGGEGKDDSAGNSSSVLMDGYRAVLSLLEEYVLKVDEFGHSVGGGAVRSCIDPVFATRLCLRVWLVLQLGASTGARPASKSNIWLESWFRSSLGMNTSRNNAPSVKKLACAALSRALLWPDNESDTVWYHTMAGKKTTILAEALDFKCSFLTELTQSCCGIMECVPASDLLNGSLGDYH